MTRICRPRPRSPQGRVATLFTRFAVTGKVSLRPNPCGNEGAMDERALDARHPEARGRISLSGRRLAGSLQTKRRCAGRGCTFQKGGTWAGAGPAWTQETIVRPVRF